MAASHRSRTAEHPRRPALRVIEGGRTQLIADIDRVAGDLRELEARLAMGRKELRLLLAALGPISPTTSWRQ